MVTTIDACCNGVVKPDGRFVVSVVVPGLAGNIVVEAEAVPAAMMMGDVRICPTAVFVLDTLTDTEFVPAGPGATSWLLPR